MAFHVKNTEAKFREYGVEKLKVSVTDHKTLANVFKIYKQAEGDDWRVVFAHDLMNLRPTEMREDIQDLRRRFDFDQLMRIAYGEAFEIVPTPEEKLLERYEELANSKHITKRTKAQGIVEALDVLGIEIQGINDVKISNLFGDDEDAPYCAI